MEVSFELVKGKGYVTDMPGRDQVVINDHSSEESKALFPTEFLLLAMGSCSSVDVLTVLEKMRKKVERFRCVISSDREEEFPKLLKNPVIGYEFWGDVDLESANRAIDISLSKYCNVSITVIRAGINLSYTISINGTQLAKIPAPGTKEASGRN